jgi:Ser/Thr protein kinase RdoA (MazF antagonist)
MTESLAFDTMTVEQQVASLKDCVDHILRQYPFGNFTAESINHEFNSTFKVNADGGQKYALRINVNSTRSLANLKAEIFWVHSITQVSVAKPIANQHDEFVTFGWHEASGRDLNAVVYSWLQGTEPGDEPTLEQLRAAGSAMAVLHESSANLVFEPGAELPDLSDFLWGTEDFLLGETSLLVAEEQQLVFAAKAAIDSLVSELQANSKKQPIHADLHPWNMMWHHGKLSIFDFDDSGMGLPVQDLATALYYLDTQEQDNAFLEGYAAVRPLPIYTSEQMKLLLLQRRILLLNYLHETSHPDHKAMIPEYQAETMSRIRQQLSI